MGIYGRAGQAANDNTTWRMRIAYRIIKATTTHSQYVVIIALPLRQWLHERVSILLYLQYTAFLLVSGFHRALLQSITFH